jgi:hypothetical protein
MKKFKSILSSVVASLFIGLIIWTFVFNWSFIFKKRVVGEIATVERVSDGFIITGATNESIPSKAFSFSVAIKDLNTGEIHMASSEDRKWAAAEKGNCVIAAFYPYPPWALSKGTTDYNARLIQNFQSCDTVEKNPSFWEKFKFFFLWV